jgi:Mg2+/Co2+ transporter CorC
MQHTFHKLLPPITSTQSRRSEVTNQDRIRKQDRKRALLKVLKILQSQEQKKLVSDDSSDLLDKLFTISNFQQNKFIQQLQQLRQLQQLQRDPYVNAFTKLPWYLRFLPPMDRRQKY